MSPALSSPRSSLSSGDALGPLLRPVAVLGMLVSLLLASSAFAAAPADGSPAADAGPATGNLLGCRSATWLATTADLTQPLCPPPAVNQPTRLVSTYLPRRPSACQVEIGPGTVLDRQWVYMLRREEKRLGIHCDILRLPPNSRDELDGR